ncbi:TNF receptor-associated factor 1 [Bradysia coprophila]|uniref:TNF receptor-associated factor 1 n=1 Tax=Bradysia coprophila TaxID=38358 RepID=UPI00187DBECA|nr:TNF receptor-associated factor 1 [Bradysia coprophila]
MENHDREVVTHIKYEKTSCYFCNEWLDAENFPNHITQCGQVLEQCPNSCNAYVQRRRIDTHLKECPKSPTTSLELYNIPEMSDVITDESYRNRLALLEQDIRSLRSTLNEEIRIRHRLISDVGGLRKHNVVSDEWTQKVGEVLNALKKCLNEETEIRTVDIEQLKVDIGRLMYHYKQLDEWRQEIRTKFEEIEESVIQDDNIRGHVEVLIKDNRITASKIQQLESGFVNLKLGLSEDMTYPNISGDMSPGKQSSMQLVLKNQQEQIDSFCRDVAKQIESVKLDFQANLKSLSLANHHRTATLDFEVKSMKHIVTETEDKCDKLEKIVVDVKKLSHQTKQLLNDLEIHMMNQRIMMEIHNTRGHLIWRIHDYAVKLKDGRENNVTLKSPMFCNKQYGYTLRLDVSLNGIGTWKGRNIIACLTVVNGEWDRLLVWPCKLQADIILRDQPDNLDDAKDISKTIVVKRKNEPHEQNQYIFIPHKTLNTRNYIRDDAIFFEVRVHRNSSN